MYLEEKQCQIERNGFENKYQKNANWKIFKKVKED
jgi:hypothetical protein